MLAAIAGPGYNHIKVASGHVRFPHVRDVVAKDQWRILTFLRNPVTHLLSHLLWVKHIGNPSAGEFRKKHSSHIQEIALRLYEIPLRRIDLVQKLIFDEFSEARQLFDNCQTRYLIPRVDRKIEPLDVNLAIANLAFVDFVFCVEQAPDAMPLVAQRLGVAKELLPDFPHSNQARLREHVDLRDEAVRDYYRELVAFDARVFVEARRRGASFISSTADLTACAAT